jgi:hypothetical protein
MPLSPVMVLTSEIRDPRILIMICLNRWCRIGVVLALNRATLENRVTHSARGSKSRIPRLTGGRHVHVVSLCRTSLDAELLAKRDSTRGAGRSIEPMAFPITMAWCRPQMQATRGLIRDSGDNPEGFSCHVASHCNQIDRKASSKPRQPCEATRQSAMTAL